MLLVISGSKLATTEIARELSQVARWEAAARVRRFQEPGKAEQPFAESACARRRAALAGELKREPMPAEVDADHAAAPRT